MKQNNTKSKEVLEAEKRYIEKLSNMLWIKELTEQEEISEEDFLSACKIMERTDEDVAEELECINARKTDWWKNECRRTALQAYYMNTYYTF